MAKKKKDKKGTLVCFLLDETGSMISYKKETIDGFNTYVDELRSEKSTKMMLTKFNTQSMSIGDAVPIAEVEELTSQNYKPNHWTPLYDAIGRTIVKADEQIDPKNVLFVIMTDGEENSSKEYTKDGIFKLIEDKKADGWQFVFLGANQDAYVAGAGMGVPKAGTATYDQARTGQTFSVAAMASARYIEDPTKDVELTDEEKKKIS